MGEGGGSHDSSGDNSYSSSVREQDRLLPIANISRIMKKGISANGKIAKDAKETLQECVSEFISFITSDYVEGETKGSGTGNDGSNTKDVVQPDNNGQLATQGLYPQRLNYGNSQAQRFMAQMQGTEQHFQMI